jgi:hypothetical protein
MAALFTANGWAQARPEKLWLLEDTKKQQWCAYTDPARFESEREATEWRTAGTVDYTDGKVSRVFLTVPEDKGEWVVSDTYAVNPTGVIESLVRYTDQFKGGFFEKSAYWIEDTQAVLLSREFMTPDDTVLPVDPAATQNEAGHTFHGHLLPDLKVWLHLIDFPFSAFLDKGHTEVWETGRSCIAISR